MGERIHPSGRGRREGRERESSKFLSIRLTTSRHSYSVKILKRAYFSTYEGSLKVFGKIFRRV